MIKFDFNTYQKNLELTTLDKDKFLEYKKRLENDSMTGWYYLDKIMPPAVLSKIEEVSLNIRNNYDVLLVIGIGGSYLGAQALKDALIPYYAKGNCEVIFAGTSLSGSYLEAIWNNIKDKKVMLNVISKSGSTLEIKLAFEYFYQKFIEKYADFADKHIVITTDPNEGELHSFAVSHNILEFPIPSNVGGRFSVLSSVGLLPICVLGFDIKRLLEGAASCSLEDAYYYAWLRHQMFLSGKIVESFTVYEEKLSYFVEWLKQLFAESHGKNHTGILPIGMINSRDLHSLGQFYQQGNKIIFETVIGVEKTNDLFSDRYEKSFDEINKIALEKVALAHFKEETYSNIIWLDKLDEYNLGYLIYFFEVACAFGGYMLGVNPFDQPGVNDYKELMKEDL